MHVCVEYKLLSTSKAQMKSSVYAVSSSLVAPDVLAFGDVPLGGALGEPPAMDETNFVQLSN